MVNRKGKFFVYIVRCANGVYYTGSTHDVEARVKRHNSGHGAKFLRGSKLPVSLVYTREFAYYKNALRAERAMKKLDRKTKSLYIASYRKKNKISIRNSREGSVA